MGLKIKRKYFWIGGLIFGLLILATVIFWPRTRCVPEGTFGFSVMSFNIGRSEPPLPTLEEVASAMDKFGTSDILFLQDVPWEIKIPDLARRLGYAYHVDQRDIQQRGSQAILSRFPLRDPDILNFDPKDHIPAALSAKARVAGKDVLICSVHLVTLRYAIEELEKEGLGRFGSSVRVLLQEFFRDSPHGENARELMAWLEKKNADHVVLGGDFNTVPWTKPMRLMTEKFHDALWPGFAYFKGTKVVSGFPDPRIDHLLLSPSLGAGAGDVETIVVGDHYPVRATIYFIQP